MACKNCQNEDYDPTSDCCPDTAESGHAIDVRGRDCKIRRMVPGKGLVGVHHGKFHQLDGSDEKPIAELDIKGVTSSDGLVIIQTTEGRILGIQPEEGTDSARIFGLVYQDGNLKFAPINELPPSFTDSSLATIKSGILASFGCAGDGSLTLGKLLPGCEGIRHLVIDANGNVTCDTIEVGGCRDVTPVDELDSVWGCKDGVFSPLLPVLGKGLVGAGDPVKWTVGDIATGKVLLDNRYFIGQRNAGYTLTTNIPAAVDTNGTTTGLQSGTFNMTTIPSYVSGFNIAWVRIQQMVNATGSGLEAIAQCIINGEVKAESWIDTVHDFGYKNDVIYPVKLTGDSFTFELYTYAQSATQTQAFTKLEVVGWEKA